MENLDKQTKAYVVSSILGFFVLISLFFFNTDLINPRNYLLLCLVFLLAIFSFAMRLALALLVCLFLVFGLGSLILYQAVFLGAVELTFARDYFWLLVFPITAFIFGRLGDLAATLTTTISRLEQKVTALVRIDELTGFSNKNKFYEDLYTETRRAKRHKFALTAVMVKIMYFDGLVSIHGRHKADEVLYSMVDIIRQVLRAEDKKYRLEPDTFAFILPNTDMEGATRVKNRLQDNLKQISLPSSQQQEILNFNFKIGILQYDGKSDDVFEFKHKLELELEYDV